MLAALALASVLFQAPAPQADDPGHIADLKRDVEEGKRYAADADKQLKPSENKEMIDRVQRIGQEIAAIARVNKVTALWGDSRLNPFDYSFKVIKGDDVNAFSLPGGFIYVYEGLVKFVESDDELAGVLAHEVSHAAFRHIATLEHEQSKNLGATIPLVLATVLTRGAAAGYGAYAAGSLFNQASMSGWSLKAELAADRGGYEYLRKSHYNPCAMLTVMERLARKERLEPSLQLGIYETHPPSKERASAILARLDSDQVPVRRSLVSTSCRVIARPTEGGQEIAFAGRRIVAFGGADAAARATIAADRLNVIFDSAPQVYEFTIDGDAIAFDHRPVFRIEPDDAGVAKLAPDPAREETLKQVKNALLILSFRVWTE